MTAGLLPGDAPVSLNEARGWLRLGSTIDDAVVAGLVRAATNICEAFISHWLVIRATEEVLPLRAGQVRLTARPVAMVETAVLLSPAGDETVLEAGGYRLRHGRDGSGQLMIAQPGDAERVRVTYRAGIAENPNGIPEAIRQGIVRMVQHLHDARDTAPVAPPAAIAALWQPWRRMTLGSGQ
ncbi:MULTISPECIES: hypothetical protein [unclassified Sphingopyxis]|uniref:head-tail connector protein n=1 Tax=unclassified Sphingopyxis TaxID=2614943 RepID=UPI002857E912|nr:MULTISPECIES: hypothetical protein [unclassified Sphingopyxis]MDR6834280.1 putative phiE125 gp8 family phage protein [Sphingopyxis sp. BE122]MDR7226549.1 putative phiE125 gp8 family phage protein [Sphingopyxis sp. BE259]